MEMLSENQDFGVPGRSAWCRLNCRQTSGVDVFKDSRHTKSCVFQL